MPHWPRGEALKWGFLPSAGVRDVVLGATAPRWERPWVADNPKNSAATP